jgi:polysaccharide pyruvyl transferase WcaK-like protein
MPTRTTDILLSEMTISDEMKELITYYIDKRVEERTAELSTPDTNAVAEVIKNSTSFARKVRVQVMDSLDYSAIAEHASSHVDIDEIVEKMLAAEPTILSSRLHNAIMSNSRFRSVVTHCVQEVLRTYSINEEIENLVSEKMLNTSNESAEKAVTIIMQRLNQGADV